MAYSKGKSKGSSTKKRTSSKKKSSGKTISKKLLEKYVETKVKKVLNGRGVPQSVPVILTPARFDRSLAAPTVTSLAKVEWAGPSMLRARWRPSSTLCCPFLSWFLDSDRSEMFPMIGFDLTMWFF